MDVCLAILCFPDFYTSIGFLSPLILHSGSRTKLCSSCLGLTAGVTRDKLAVYCRAIRDKRTGHSHFHQKTIYSCQLGPKRRNQTHELIAVSQQHEPPLHHRVFTRLVSFDPHHSLVHFLFPPVQNIFMQLCNSDRRQNTCVFHPPCLSTPSELLSDVALGPH